MTQILSGNYGSIMIFDRYFHFNIRAIKNLFALGGGWNDMMAIILKDHLG
jgi:hypothetical protein